MLGIVTHGLKTSREGWRERRIHQEAQSCAPQDWMIVETPARVAARNWK
jgi:hypothetical protein